MIASIRTDLVMPSWMNGFARNASECIPEARSLWDKKRYHGAPVLGPTGTTLRDVSGYGRNAPISGIDPATQWPIGRMGYAIDFDGVDAFATVGNHDNLSNPGGGLSVCAWIKRDTSDRRSEGLIGKYESLNEYNLSFTVTSPGALWWFVYDADQDAFVGREMDDSVFDDTDWHCIVATHDGGTTPASCKIYVDGVQSDTSDLSSGTYIQMRNTTDNLFIGKAPTWSAVEFDGQISEARLYARELVAQEARLIYEIPYADLIVADDFVGAAVISGAHQGAGTLSGTGNIVGDAGVRKPGAGALSGTGNLAGDGTRRLPGAGTLSGIGSLVGDAGVRRPGAGTLSGVGSLSGDAGLRLPGAGALSGTGTLSGDLTEETTTKQGAGTLSGVGSLSGGAGLRLPGAGAFSGVGNLSGDAGVRRPGAGTLSGVGTLAGDLTDASVGTPVEGPTNSLITNDAPSKATITNDAPSQAIVV